MHMNRSHVRPQVLNARILKLYKLYFLITMEENRKPIEEGKLESPQSVEINQHTLKQMGQRIYKGN